jgi:type II secretory pathway component PulF
MSLASSIPVIGTYLANLEARLDFWLARQTFDSQSRKMFYRRFSAQTASKGTTGKVVAGKTTKEALVVLEQVYTESGRKPNSSRGRLCAELRTALQNGLPLSIALESWVPPSERAIIDAGEKSSRLSEAFTRAIQMIDKTQAMGRATREASSAGLLVAALVGLLIYFSTSLIPEIKTIVEGSTVTGTGAILIAVSDAVAAGYIWFLFFAAALVSSIIVALPRLGGPIRLFLDDFPVFREYRMIQGGKFMVSFATLMDAGKTEMEAMEALRPHANPYVAERIDIAMEGLAEGRSFAQALLDARTNFPDSEILYDIAAASGSKSAAAAILDSVFDWLDVAIMGLKNRFAALNAGLQVAVTAIMIMLVSGIYSIVEGVQQAARLAS